MRKKVVFLIAHLGGGGAERVTVTLANFFSNNGCDVYMIAFSDKYNEYPLDEKVKLKFLPEHKENKVRNVIGKIFALKKSLAKINPSAVISLGFSYRYLFFGNLMNKYNHILSERNDPRQQYPNKWELEIVKYCLRCATHVVFQTKDAMKFYSDEIQKHASIIPNPIKEGLPDAYHGERDKRIIAYSRLSEQKNIPMMLRAFKKFLANHSEYILEIYGRGESEEYLKKYAVELGIADQVFFAGFAQNVHERILHATCFLSTSNYEGISNSMLESLAIGLPCVCTDCPVGGASMFIRDGINGFLTPVGDEEATAQALHKLVSSPKLVQQMSIEAEKIRFELATDKICNQWLKLI